MPFEVICDANDLAVGAVLGQRSEGKPYVVYDSCHGRVMRNQQNLYSYVPPTAVVKLLQHSGLGSNTGMGFHPMNDVHQCLKMVRLLFWIFGFVSTQWELVVY